MAEASLSIAERLPLLDVEIANETRKRDELAIRLEDALAFDEGAVQGVGRELRAAEANLERFSATRRALVRALPREKLAGLEASVSEASDALRARESEYAEASLRFERAQQERSAAEGLFQRLQMATHKLDGERRDLENLQRDEDDPKRAGKLRDGTKILRDYETQAAEVGVRFHRALAEYTDAESSLAKALGARDGAVSLRNLRTQQRDEFLRSKAA
jgi:hypothetical protein